MASKTEEQKLTSVDVGERFLINGTIHPVAPACADKNNGNWFCVTHEKWFDNQFQKDTHINRGKHKLAWVCRKHGLEKP